MKTEPDLELIVRQRIQASLAVKQAMLEDRALVRSVEEAARLIAGSLGSGHQLLLFGNGGSAADAQHIAAELVGKYLRVRPPLAAIALTVNTSSLTAIANDLAFDQVFARQVEALGSAGDVALGISTSGESPNVLAAIEVAKRKGLGTLGLTGRQGSKLQALVGCCISVPCDETPRIQEAHILIGHILCEIVEQELAPG